MKHRTILHGIHIFVLNLKIHVRANPPVCRLNTCFSGTGKTQGKSDYLYKGVNMFKIIHLNRDLCFKIFNSKLSVPRFSLYIAVPKKILYFYALTPINSEGRKSRNGQIQSFKRFQIHLHCKLWHIELKFVHILPSASELPISQLQ